MQAVQLELTIYERDELVQCEQVIEQGLKTFVAVGNALLTIRDQRLYREQYGTFEGYCRERWRMERSHAYRLMDASSVVGYLSPMGDILPTSERQARPLARLEPEQQRQAWACAVETAPNGRVTGAHVQGVVDQMTERRQHTMRVMGSSESAEWYTPKHIIDLTLKLFGKIDLDPCSNSHERPNVPAGALYTKEDDGLAQEWFGRVYMNPPYGREIERWTSRLVKEYRAGSVVEAIALLPGRIDTQWFQPLYAFPICNVCGRLSFVGSSTGAPFPSVVVYLGTREQKFIETFKHIGPIVKRIA